LGRRAAQGLKSLLKHLAQPCLDRLTHFEGPSDPLLVCTTRVQQSL
jgi:hypothetical protein